MRRRWLALVCGASAAALVGGVTLTVVATSVEQRGSPTPTPPAPATAAAAPSPARSTPSPTGAARPTGVSPAPAPTVRPFFPRHLAGQDLTRLPTSRRLVALTFDGGANAAGLPRILDTLAREHVAATFYLTGQFVAAHPSAVAAIAARGHRMGNHSATHPHFTELTDAEIAAQLQDAERAIRAQGADPRPLFRFPYGDRDTRTIRAVNAGGYLPVRWTVDTLGWQGTADGNSAQRVVDRTLAALTPGEIVLMHLGSHPTDGSTLDADALPDMIAELRARDYAFATLDYLLAIPEIAVSSPA